MSVWLWILIVVWVIGGALALVWLFTSDFLKGHNHDGEGKRLE